MKKYILAISAVSLMFVGCKGDESGMDASELAPSSITFSSAITAATRVDSDQFEAGDVIYVSALDGEASYADKVEYTYADGVFSSASPIEYYTDAQTLSFSAVYPAIGEFSATTQFSFEIETDQSINSGYENSDLLISSSSSSVHDLCPELSFEHKMSSLVINLSEDTEGEVIYAMTNVNINLTDDTCVAWGATQNIIPASAGDKSLKVIIAPQTIAKGDIIAEVTYNGFTYTWVADQEIEFNSGYRYTYSWDIEAEEITLESYIQGWNDDTLVWNIISNFGTSVDEVEFDLFGYSADATIGVTSDDGDVWTVDSITVNDGTEGWLTISDESGAALSAGSTVTGSQNITLAASINGSGTISMSASSSSLNVVSTAAEERSATVTLSQGLETKTITVTQNSTDVPHFTPTTNSAVNTTTGATSDAQTFEFDVAATSIYRLKDIIDWLSFTVSDPLYTYTSGSLYTCFGNQTVTVTFEENKHSRKRGGWYSLGKYDGIDFAGIITVASDYNDTYTYGNWYFYQQAASPMLEVTPSQSTFEYLNATSATFTVESNISWTATSDVEWLTVDDSQTFSRTTDGVYTSSDYTFNLSENYGDERSAVVTFTPSLATTGTDRDDITLPEAVTVTITQGIVSYVEPASFTAFVSSTDTNTVTLTANKEFTTGQTFSASEFELNYTNSYAGSVGEYVSASTSASGSIAISSIALDADDATKMVITTSDSVYNTDALTLTYSGSGLALASGASFPASLTFETSYAEYYNEDFELDAYNQTAAERGWYVMRLLTNYNYDATYMYGENENENALYVVDPLDTLDPDNLNDKLNYVGYVSGDDTHTSSLMSPTVPGVVGDVPMSLKFKMYTPDKGDDTNGFSSAFNSISQIGETVYKGNDPATYNGGWHTNAQITAGSTVWADFSTTITAGTNYALYDDLRFALNTNGYLGGFYIDDIYLGNAVPRP